MVNAGVESGVDEVETQETPADAEFLTVDECARALRVSKQTISLLTTNGKLAYCAAGLNGGAVRIRRCDWEAYIASIYVPATPTPATPAATAEPAPPPRSRRGRPARAKAG